MSLQETEILFGSDFFRAPTQQGRLFTVNSWLAANVLMSVYWAIRYKDDRVFFVDGTEGSGKTTLALQLAALITWAFHKKQFDSSNVVYSMEDLKRRYYNGIEWEVIVYDESDEGVNRLETLKRDNIDFNKFMKQARQAHKILIMCGPSIYDISSYVAQHRVKALIHCYKESNVHPGNFLFFNERTIHKLFIYDKRERTYRQKASFLGAFSSVFPIDDTAYNAKKKAAFMKFAEGLDLNAPQPVSYEQAVLRWQNERIKDWPKLKERAKGLSIKDFTTVLGITRRQLRNAFRRNGMDVNFGTGATRPLGEIDPDEGLDVSELELDAEDEAYVMEQAMKGNEEVLNTGEPSNPPEVT